MNHKFKWLKINELRILIPHMKTNAVTVLNLITSESQKNSSIRKKFPNLNSKFNPSYENVTV